MKRKICIFFSLLLCISILFLVFGPSVRTLLWGATPREAYDVLETIYSEDGEFFCFLYNDCRYFYDELGSFDVIEDDGKLGENYELLSWNGSVKVLSYAGLDLINKYYAIKTEDPPPFIYLQRVERVYFSEKYNFWSDTFIIEDTKSEVVLSSAVMKNVQIDGDVLSSKAHFRMFSKTYPSLYADVLIYEVQGMWYLGGNGFGKGYAINDSFLKSLQNNGLIKLNP